MPKSDEVEVFLALAHTVLTTVKIVIKVYDFNLVMVFIFNLVKGEQIVLHLDVAAMHGRLVGGG